MSSYYDGLSKTGVYDGLWVLPEGKSEKSTARTLHTSSAEEALPLSPITIHPARGRASLLSLLRQRENKEKQVGKVNSSSSVNKNQKTFLSCLPAFSEPLLRSRAAQRGRCAAGSGAPFRPGSAEEAPRTLSTNHRGLLLGLGLPPAPPLRGSHYTSMCRLVRLLTTYKVAVLTSCAEKALF